MSTQLTEEQARAVGARGKVIVSASAGSGKTFVMIERLVSLILAGADVRQILAVTYTNKAAAQMRDRLRSALIKRIGESGEEERRRLKEQLSYLPLADICTVHSFCARLVRTYFYLIDADPAFRIVSAEEREGAVLSARALDEVFEEAYENDSRELAELLPMYFRSKKDAMLRGLVLGLYNKMRVRDDYRERLETMGKTDDFEEIAAYLAEDIHLLARFVAGNALEQQAYYRAHGSAAAGTCEKLIAAADALSGGDLFTLAACRVTIPPKPSSPSASAALKEQFARTGRLCAALRGAVKTLQSYASREEEHARYLQTLGTVRALAALVLRFDAVFTRIKREEGVLDYNDLEHCALSVLSHEDARDAVRDKYTYIFVDEYQDVNPAQEHILSLLSGEEIFLVGDAKQSIYGFRGSRSEYFTRKCAEFGERTLTENFRSARAVLDGVNRVFSYAMTSENGGVCYRNAPMRGGSRYGGHDGGVFFHTIPAEEREERAARGVYSVLTEIKEKPDAQAQLLCGLIGEEVGTEWFDADEGVVKKVGFGDIAVLVRSDTAGTERILSALSERGIPVVTTAQVNICSYWEIRLLIDWLSYLDNAEQDIPLAAAMLSRVGLFTEGELARIRLRFSFPSFRIACREYSEKMKDGIAEKLHTFYQKADRYRALSRVRPAAEMMELLLGDGLEAEISARRDGTARMRRVRRFIEEAEESTGAFLRRLKATGYKVKFSESGGEDAVKVLTMHSAKGLEYPIVFLANLDAPFHSNEREEVLCTDRFLFAPKSFDVEKRIVRGNLLRSASVLYEDRETVKGELNLLYVAMTRAKYRLHLLLHEREHAIAPQYAERMSDFIDLGACADLYVRPHGELPPPLPRTARAYRADERLLSAFQSVYERKYPFAESTLLPVKSSATELLKSGRETSAGESGGGGATIDEGLAYHAFLEHVQFGADATAELLRMRQEGILNEEELSLLEADKLKKILALPSLARLEGKRLYREQTFLVSLPARELTLLSTSSADEVLFQGAIDLLCEDEEGYLILDYKFSSHDAARMKKDYAPQIALYRKAVSKVMGVDERTIRARLINILGLFEVEM